MRSAGFWPQRAKAALLLVVAVAACQPATDTAAPGAPTAISTATLPPPPASAPTETLAEAPAETPGATQPEATAAAPDPASAPETSTPLVRETAAPPGPPPLPVPTTLFGRKVQDDLQHACTQSGGRFGPRGKSGALACFITPRDAGKSCTRKTDCTGQCLARSNTCSPVIPLLGCHEILTENGARVTECLE